MKRWKVRSAKNDRRIFRHTAQKMNSINVYDVIPRGGTRM